VNRWDSIPENAKLGILVWDYETQTYKYIVDPVISKKQLIQNETSLQKVVEAMRDIILELIEKVEALEAKLEK
jgi:hypothetical protein